MIKKKTVKDYIRTIPDFPVPGVMFRDVTTLFNDADGFQLAIDEMIGDMTEYKRTIIQLRIQGHQVQDIAKETGRSKRTIERVIQQFKLRLSKLIDDE